MKSLKITLTLAAALAAFAVAPARAVTIDNAKFELDGDIVKNLTNGYLADWASLFDVSGSSIPTIHSPQPTGFIKSPRFLRDFTLGKTDDSTTYTTGSKDILNIGGGGWQCTKSNNVNDKVDVLNAYATAQTDKVNGVDHVFVYFGMEVASNEGTKDVGFWFLKDQTVGCTAGAHATNFTGNHTDGDLLIVSEYTKGGGVSTIKAYRWVGGADGFLDTNPVVSGADCQDGSGTAGICATVNRSPLLHSNEGVPWLTQTKAGNGLTSADLDNGEFFEGGIDLTANGLTGCFSQFLADTRSSATPTATLFDFTVGEFDLCGFSVGKKCDTGASNNPHVLADGSTLETQFKVSITNDGLATLYNIRLHEKDLQTGESCRITAISGGTYANPPTFPVTFPSPSYELKVADSLGGGQTMFVTVICDSPNNPYLNSVTAKANPASDGSGTDLTASHKVVYDTQDQTKNEACPFSTSPALGVVKRCSTDPNKQPPVTLSLTGGATVYFDVVLTNNAAEDLKDITVDDNKSGNVVTGDTLNVGQSKTYTKYYTTTSADTVTNPTYPCNIQFTDQLTNVSGKGVVSDKTVTVPSPLPSITCPLCPNTCPR